MFYIANTSHGLTRDLKYLNVRQRHLIQQSMKVCGLYWNVHMALTITGLQQCSSDFNHQMSGIQQKCEYIYVCSLQFGAV